MALRRRLDRVAARRATIGLPHVPFRVCEGRSAMRFLLGLLLGIALGVAVGLVLAPQPGSETRKALREQLQKSGEGGEEDDASSDGETG